MFVTITKLLQFMPIVCRSLQLSAPSKSTIIWGSKNPRNALVWVIRFIPIKVKLGIFRKHVIYLQKSYMHNSYILVSLVN